MVRLFVVSCVISIYWVLLACGIQMKCLSTWSTTKWHSGYGKDFWNSIRFFSPPVSLVSFIPFKFFKCCVRNVYHFCVLSVLQFSRLTFQRTVLYSWRNFSHLGVWCLLIAHHFRLIYLRKLTVALFILCV